MIKRKSVRSSILILFILGLGAAVFFIKQKNSAPAGSVLPKIIGGMVPDVMLRNSDGGVIALSGFRGKPAVVLLWASWCPFCRDQLADAVLLEKELGNKVTVLAVNRGESAERVEMAARELGIGTSSLMLLDAGDALYPAVGGFAMPETLFVDTEGVIRAHRRGPMTREELKRHILNLVEL